jgi:hypothetical protein
MEMNLVLVMFCVCVYCNWCLNHLSCQEYVCDLTFLLLSIAEKYPEIKNLFGCDPNFKWVVVGMVLIQFFMMYVMIDQSWPMIFLVAYCFGGVMNHSLMLGESSQLLSTVRYF